MSWWITVCCLAFIADSIAAPHLMCYFGICPVGEDCVVVLWILYDVDKLDIIETLSLLLLLVVRRCRLPSLASASVAQPIFLSHVYS